MSDLFDFLSVLAQIANFIGELATLPSFPNSIWERTCQRNSVALRTERDGHRPPLH